MATFVVCPNCGEVFKRPAMDQKNFGFGWTVPGLGVIECPECKEKKGRKYFRIAEEKDFQSRKQNGESLQSGSSTSEKDRIEYSRFEDE